MARPARTLILVSRRMVARGDFARGRVVGSGVQVRQRPDLPDLYTAVEFALSFGGRVGREVWVLTTDCWTQTVGLASSKATGLSFEELAAALNFEVESLSGNAAMESELGFQPLPSPPGEKHFWVTQVTISDLQSLSTLIAREGSKLVGVCHPAGLAQADQVRIELWPDAVVAIDPAPRTQNDNGRLRVWHQDPQGGRLPTELQAWLQANGAEESANWLAVDGVTQIGPRRKCLDDLASLTEWLTAANAVLGSRKPAVPVIRPTRQPVSGLLRGVLAAGLAILVAVVCGAYWKKTESHIDELGNAVLEQRQAAARQADLVKQIKTRNAEREKLRQQKVQTEETASKLERMRERHVRLLELLASHKPDEVLIRVIDRQGDVPRVCGLTLRHEEADAFVRRLHEPLQALGWEIQPAKETALNRFPDGGPWEFEFVIAEVVEAKPSTDAKPTAKR